MKKIVMLFVVGTLQVVFAYGDWVSMTKYRSKSIDFTYAKCYYKDMFGNFNISIVVKGSTFSCPYSIQYNPVTREWK